MLHASPLEVSGEPDPTADFYDHIDSFARRRSPAWHRVRGRQHVTVEELERIETDALMLERLEGDHRQIGGEA